MFRKRASTLVRMDTSPSQNLSDNVRRARERSGLNQRDFALMVGVSRPIISAIEQGKEINIKLTTLHRLAEGIGVEPWELLK